MLINSIKGTLLDVESIRYWQKDPDAYVRSATSAVFNLIHRDFAPLADRLRSVIARERQIPMLLSTGKANIEHPPRAFVDIAIRNVAGSITFLKIGAPATFAAVEDQQLKREFTASNDSAIAAFENYKTYLEQELKPKADGDFALGSDLFAQRIAYNEMVDIPPDRLLDIAYAQLHKDQAALSEAARRVNPTASIEDVLKEIRAQHPTVDTLIPTARDDLAGLRAFVLDHHIATIPSDLLPKVEETPGFRRTTTSAAMDPPGPLERRATQAFYYVTPPDAGLAPDKLEQYLEAYYFPALEIISVHEVWPGCNEADGQCRLDAGEEARDLEKGRNAARVVIGARAAGDRVVVRADQKDFTITCAAASGDFEVQATNSRDVIGKPLDGIALLLPFVLDV